MTALPRNIQMCIFYLKNNCFKQCFKHSMFFSNSPVHKVFWRGRRGVHRKEPIDKIVFLLFPVHSTHKPEIQGPLGRVFATVSHREKKKRLDQTREQDSHSSHTKFGSHLSRNFSSLICISRIWREITCALYFMQGCQKYSNKII